MKSGDIPPPPPDLPNLPPEPFPDGERDSAQSGETSPQYLPESAQEPTIGFLDFREPPRRISRGEQKEAGALLTEAINKIPILTGSRVFILDLIGEDEMPTGNRLSVDCSDPVERFGFSSGYKDMVLRILDAEGSLQDAVTYRVSKGGRGLRFDYSPLTEEEVEFANTLLIQLHGVSNLSEEDLRSMHPTEQAILKQALQQSADRLSARPKKVGVPVSPTEVEIVIQRIARTLFGRPFRA